MTCVGVAPPLTSLLSSPSKSAIRGNLIVGPLVRGRGRVAVLLLTVRVGVDFLVLVVVLLVRRIGAARFVAGCGAVIGCGVTERLGLVDYSKGRN